MRARDVGVRKPSHHLRFQPDFPLARLNNSTGSTIGVGQRAGALNILGPAADGNGMRRRPERTGTWLCPTEFDRARTVDMEERLQGARAVLFGSLGVGFAAAGPWIGWLPVGLVVVQVTF